MASPELFGGSERVIAGSYSDWGESGCGAFRNGRASKRMRQSFHFRVVLKRDVRRFVGGHEDENLYVASDVSG